ncbi:MAG: energy transducer TonB, partial [Bacteroidales bacterium]
FSPECKKRTNMKRTVSISKIICSSIFLLFSASVFSQSQTDTSKEEIYEKPEVMPQYAGGDYALVDYISKQLDYPINAMKNNVEGMVLVQFVINEEGYVHDVTVVKSVDPQLDSAAVAVVSTLPRFKSPGMQDGKPVSVYYRVPIGFSLEM